MGLGEEIKNSAEELGGKAKEAYGDAANNKQVKAEGIGDQLGAQAKQLGEDAKNIAQNAADKAKEAINDVKNN